MCIRDRSQDCTTLQCRNEATDELQSALGLGVAQCCYVWAPPLFSATVQHRLMATSCGFPGPAGVIWCLWENKKEGCHPCKWIITASHYLGSTEQQAVIRLTWTLQHRAVGPNYWNWKYFSLESYRLTIHQWIRCYCMTIIHITVYTYIFTCCLLQDGLTPDPDLTWVDLTGLD